MPYWLEGDEFATDPTWGALAKGNADRKDFLQAAYCRLKAAASHVRSDGYLTDEMALAHARNRPQLLELLATPILGRPPKLHRPGDECVCLGDGPWIDGYAWRIHAFLKRNPSRAEHERNRTQKADLRDARLKTSVYTRDGGCCRYCRSGPLSPKAVRARDRRKVLSYDHIDPDKPAGTDGANLVVACGRCNEHKGHRTPYEADMTLLAEPTPAERAAWVARGIVLLDPVDQPMCPPDQRADHPQTANESPTNQKHVTDQITDRITEPISDPPGDPITDHDANTTTSPGLNINHHPADQHRQRSGEGLGSGRVGEPASDTPRPPQPQPERSTVDPDIYHRRSRQSTPPPSPATDYLWPPGSVPAQQRRSDPPSAHPVQPPPVDQPTRVTPAPSTGEKP